MIKIFGTTHLAKEVEILEIIENEKPDVLGVELCDYRVQLLSNEKETSSQPDKSLLSKITSKIKAKSEESGMDYGSDQKTVLRYAQNSKLPLLPVDMPILKIQELFSKIPKEEQEGFQKELQEFQNQPLIEQQDEKEVIQNLKTRYPIAFEFLINMRNLYISNQLLKAEKKYPNKKILVFLGKSHVEQIKQMVK
jgi:pheromone shutdown protein TraB